MASKDLKYRALCPHCHQAFDMRGGILYQGHLHCPDCGRDLKYRTYTPNTK